MISVDILNRRLGEALGYRGAQPRFSWRYAPDELWFTFDRDDRTLLKRTWAHRPGPAGGVIGRAWVLAEWRRSQVFDHFGFGDGMRVPFIREFGYEPYMETVLPEGAAPTDELTANYISAIRWQLDQSAEQKEDSFGNWMAEEAWTSQKNGERDRDVNRERAAAEYDKYTGAYGNLQPGQIDGWMSFGGLGDSPVVAKLKESAA